MGYVSGRRGSRCGSRRAGIPRSRGRLGWPRMHWPNTDLRVWGCPAEQADQPGDPGHQGAYHRQWQQRRYGRRQEPSRSQDQKPDQASHGTFPRVRLPSTGRSPAGQPPSITGKNGYQAPGLRTAVQGKAIKRWVGKVTLCSVLQTTPRSFGSCLLISGRGPSILPVDRLEKVVDHL